MTKQPRKSLYEVYRPRSFDEVVGQDKAVAKIQRTVQNRWGGWAWWISGPSGTGKTTLARIIAWQGHNTMIREFDGAYSFDITMVKHLQQTRHFGGLLTGKVYIVNEAHCMRKPIIQN